MSAYLVFDTDGHCIEKHPDVGVTIMQDTAVAVDSLADYPGMDWIYADAVITSMTEEQSRLRRRKLKSAKLQAAESAYEGFLSQLGLSIKSNSADIMTKLITMKATNTTLSYNGIELAPAEIQGIISALMHDIEVNGGGWSNL